MPNLEPIATASVGDARSQLAHDGFAFVDGSKFDASPSLAASMSEFADAFDRLEPDGYLQDGSTFRLRRYGRFLLARDGTLRDLPTAPYFQATEINSYAGGIDRSFADLEADTRRNEMLKSLIQFDASVFEARVDAPFDHWRVEVHPLRIVARHDEVGLPTPEGLHRDGNDFFAVHLIRREGVLGGETTVCDVDRRPLKVRTLREPLDSLLVNDHAVLHGVSPIVPEDEARPGFRDVVVIDFFIVRTPLPDASDPEADSAAQMPATKTQ